MFVSIPKDSGNIQVINQENAQNIRLKIRPDNRATNKQWFNFIINGEAGEEFILHIENAGTVSYPKWNEEVAYRAVASSNQDSWERLDTQFDEKTGVLTIRGKLVNTSMQIAYFAPYPYDRHVELIEKAKKIKNCTVSSLGKSVEGRDLTLLTVGTPGPDKKNIWIIARQHPGETMAEWYVEGLIERLQTEALDGAVLHIIPNMNPDGSYHGNLRTNAAGKDLNRQWAVFDNQNTAPEVFYVRQAMLKTMRKEGIAAFFDIHGDETHPYVFPDGRGLGCSNNPELIALENEFLDAYIKVCPYLEKESKYEPDLPGEANLNIANAFWAEYTNCLSFVFEMPNKELNHGKDWTNQECKQFGASLIDPLAQLLPKLSNKRFKSINSLDDLVTQIKTKSFNTHGGGTWLQIDNKTKNVPDGVYKMYKILTSEQDEVSKIAKIQAVLDKKRDKGLGWFCGLFAYRDSETAKFYQEIRAFLAGMNQPPKQDNTELYNAAQESLNSSPSYSI